MVNVSHEGSRERTIVFPEDAENLEALAEMNRQLVEERAAGSLKMIETVQASGELAEIIRRSTGYAGADEEVSGIEIEVDETQLDALSISRRLGDLMLQ